MGVTRRTFVAGAAAVCAGCRSDGGDAAPADQSTTRPNPRDAGVRRPDVAPDAAPSEDPLGGPVDIGGLDDVVAAIEAGDGFHYVPEARTWMVRYPPEAIADAQAEYDGAGDASIDRGLVALHQKCTHLGCRVPECRSSGRFECPCHGSVFNRVGEWVAGPAPRGLDRFPVTVVGGRVRVDVGTMVEGRDRGVSTLPAEQAGPSCIPS